MTNEKDQDDDLEPLRLIHEQEAADYAQYKADAASRNYDEVTRTDAGGRFTVYGFNQIDRASVYVTATGEIVAPIFERAMSDDRTGPNADYFRIEAGPYSDITGRMSKLISALEAVPPSYRLSFIEKQPADHYQGPEDFDGTEQTKDAAPEPEQPREFFRTSPGFGKDPGPSR